MQKFTFLFTALLLISKITFAKEVGIKTAQNVATNYYNQTSKKTANGLSLAHTQSAVNGQAVFYVFNVNTNDGFVIVAADDAVHPILGYSDEGKFVIPEYNTTVAYWLRSRANEITTIRNANLSADITIKNEWSGNFNNNSSSNKVINNANQINAVLPLCQTTWNQSPNYNALCPGGSVTGCVATAMGQIMKRWNYPNTGTGSSSYCDCTAYGFQVNYGTLTANYAATTFTWGSMPNALSGSNSAVADLMIKLGTSVDMDYSPSGSGAWVITSDNPICAQSSYINYFKYDPNTIQGLMRVYYSDPAWIALLKADLDLGRPIQYAGYENATTGHTWVCDGYDASNNFHMNWGWGGADNGYYSMTNLNPNPYTFNLGQEALIGIQPLPYSNFNLSANPMCAGQTITISDLSANNPTAWSYTLTGGTPSLSSAQNPTVTYASPGVYTITLISSNNTNTSVPIVKTITVGSTPILTVTASPICSGGTASIISSGGSSYTLNAGGTGSNIPVSPTVTTTYTVSSFNGCNASQAVTVVVNPTPTVSISASANSVCAGNPVNLNAGGAASYSWNNGSVTNSTTVNPSANTVYIVNGTTGPCSANASVSINVYPLPNITVSGNDSLICEGQTNTLVANGALSYTWNNGAVAPIITDTPNNTTTYTVTGTNAYGCTASVVISQSVATCAGIAEHRNNPSFNIYPNPNSGEFTISSGISSNLNLEIYNHLGQLILKDNIQSQNYKVSLRNQAAGVYQIRITENGADIFKTKILKN